MTLRWTQRHRLFRERLAIAQARQREDPSEDSLLHDPIEDDPNLLATFEEADALTDAALEGRPQGMGFCHIYWATKQGILDKRFGITWFTPSDMNPDVLFD